MRMSELAGRSGVPVATVKYYLREGLLPPGRQVHARLAEYDEAHVQRLRLLRVLREVGDVPVERLRDVVRAVEDDTLSPHGVLAAAAVALAPSPSTPGPGRGDARELARRLVRDAGWSRVDESSTDLENLAATLEVLLAFAPAMAGDAGLRCYTEAADVVARGDIASLSGDVDAAALTEQMVVGQVVFGQLLLVLRRLAEEHHSAVRFG